MAYIVKARFLYVDAKNPVYKEQREHNIHMKNIGHAERRRVHYADVEVKKSIREERRVRFAEVEDNRTVYRLPSDQFAQVVNRNREKEKDTSAQAEVEDNRTVYKLPSGQFARAINHDREEQKDCFAQVEVRRPSKEDLIIFFNKKHKVYIHKSTGIQIPKEYEITPSEYISGAEQTYILIGTDELLAQRVEKLETFAKARAARKLLE